jgi:hypothetical protein
VNCDAGSIDPTDGMVQLIEGEIAGHNGWAGIFR